MAEQPTEPLADASASPPASEASRAPEPARPPSSPEQAATGSEPSVGREPTAGAEAAADAEPTPPADFWAAFDAVLEAFARARPVGAGTFYGDDLATPVGRFAGWTNHAGWECTVRLVREPTENMVVVVVDGPPLAGGQPRQLPLTVLPAEFEPDALRVGLEFGYLIGETWGPREEPSPTPSPEPATPAADADSAPLG